MNSNRGRKGSSWWRKLSWVLGALAALLLLVYFTATSSAFVKSFILPRIGPAIGADLAAEQVSLSPFSQLVLQKVQVRTTGTEPLVTADEAKVRYDLFAILRGDIDVHEVTLTAPQVHIAIEADGKSNLDPLLRPAEPAPKTSAPASPLRLNVRNMNVKNGQLRMISRQKDGTIQTVEIENLNLAVDQLRNGTTGKVSLSAEAKLAQSATGAKIGGSDRAQAKLAGELALGLDAQLMPSAIQGAVRVDLTQADGAFKDLAGLSANLQADTTLNEIRQFALRFERAGKALGSIAASGPFNLEKRETRLQLDIQSIDRQVLNLIGAPRGWDFGDSTLNASGTVEVAQKGAAIATAGSIVGNRVGIRQAAGATPPLDLNLEYQINLNLDQKTGSVAKLSLSAKENQRDLLQASLDRPMPLNWGGATASVPDSTLQLAVRDFNLHSWQAVLGTNVPGGRVNLQLTLQTQQDGKKLSTKLAGDVQELAAKVGTNRIERAMARFAVSGQVADLRVVDLDSYRLELLLQNQVVASHAGTLHYDLAKNEVNLKADSEASLPDLLKPFPVPELKAATGKIRSAATFTQNSRRRAASGQLQLVDFTGGFGNYALTNFQASADYSGEIAGNDVQVQRANVTFGQNGQPAGGAELSGRYHLTNNAAQISFKLSELNQQLLRPFLASALGEMQLVSMTLNGLGTASYDPKKESALKADLKVANLVVEDPQRKLPRTPLSAEVQLDGSNRQQVLDLRQLALKLSPTPRAQNEIQLKGRLDLSPSNATPSQLILEADSLDLTPYYDLFAGNAHTNQPGPKPQPPAVQTGEPAPVSLPLQQLTADLKIGRCYLRDVALTNVQGTAKINRGEVTLQPLQFALNGAPVSTKAVLDLSVPGYKYDVAFKADRMPLNPLASSFGGRSGSTLQGVLLADAQLKGAGVSGANLQKNLSGQITLSLTNLSFEIVGKKVKALLEPIALVLRVPELTLTPLEWVNARADVGQGKVNVGEFSVFSQAFYANGQGVVQLAPVLSNSIPNIPVAIALRRSLAEKAHLVPQGTPANAAYVQLPTFAKLGGTLGEPKTEIDKLVVSGLLLQSASGIPKVSEKTGNLLQGLGGILSGRRPGVANTNLPAGTNSNQAVQTNKPAKFNPLDLLELIPKKK